MVVSRDAIREQFSLLGVKATDASLDKCLDLCASYGVSAEALVDTWISFTVSFLKGADPSPETLALMERRELRHAGSYGVATPSGLVIYSQEDDDPGGDQDQIVQLYSTTPKAKTAVGEESVRTPERRNFAKLLGRSPRPAFSPASFSPTTAAPSTNYSSRTNSGDVVFNFPEGSSGGEWTSETRFSPSVSALLAEVSTSDYMADVLKRKAKVLDDVLSDFSDVYLRTRGLEELANPTLRIFEEQWTVGRIACDEMGRLNVGSVVLECARSIAGGKSVYLNLRQLEKYSLFPGQLVALCGTNHSGDSFTVTKLVTDFSPLFPFLPSGLVEPEAQVRTRIGLPETDGSLQIVVAAGPYTQTDTMLYQPLQDLVEYLDYHEPHVAVLCGPFVDVRHPHVEEGSLAETFDAVFERILDGVSAALRGRTQVVLVPSYRDAHHYPVYPTPPFVPGRGYPGLHVLPDPCVFGVEGVKIGVTSADVLMHLGKEEMSFPPQSPDRLGRLAGHVLSQGCFYPTFPPAEDVNLDVNSWRDGCKLSPRPHLLVLPSDLRFFVKEVDGCVVVNPGRLSKGLSGGTMARIEVPAFSGDANFCEVVKAQILRI